MRVKFTSINSHIMYVVICTGNVHCAAFYSVGCGEKILKAKNTSFSQPGIVGKNSSTIQSFSTNQSYAMLVCFFDLLKLQRWLMGASVSGTVMSAKG